jgi:hypothetical protein
LGPILTVSVSGNGTVSSSPAGINCPTVCSASFVSGTAITLTATANDSNFGGWQNCDTVNGQVCTINSLNGDRTVTVTFN